MVVQKKRKMFITNNMLKKLFLITVFLFHNTALGDLQKNQTYEFKGKIIQSIDMATDITHRGQRENPRSNSPIRILSQYQENIFIEIDEISNLNNENINSSQLCVMKVDAAKSDLTIILRIKELHCSSKKEAKVYRVNGIIDATKYKTHKKTEKSWLFSDKITEISLPKNTEVIGGFQVTNIEIIPLPVN